MHIYIDDSSTPMKEFQLPAEFRPELSRTNPFLSDEGSQSVPLTLPASNHNLQQIGFMHRGTSTQRPIKKIPAIMADGAAWMQGTLYIEQVNKIEGINCTFYTNEGQLYEKVKDYKLRDLNWPELKGIGSDYTTKAKYWMNKFLRIIRGNEAQPDEYYICNVWTDNPFYIGESKKGSFLFLNELSYENEILSFYAMKEQVYYEENDENATQITAPVGFGVTPFLRVGYVLRHLFNEFGYILDTNIFDLNESLKRLIVLNNVADAIIDGNIYFKQLLPNVTVEDFLKAIRLKFGLEFIQKGSHIYINFWKDNLKSSPDMDLSKYIRDKDTFLLEDKKAISMEFEPLTDQPDYVHTRNVEFEKQKNDSLLKHSAPSGFVEESIETVDKTPYYYQNLTAYMRDAGIEGTLKSIRTIFINEVQYRNSNLVIDGELDDENGEDMDIAFCFSDTTLSTFDSVTHGKKKYIEASNISDYLSLFASEYKTTQTIYYENNIYNALYKDRDIMLQKANQGIIAKALIPSHIISTMDISTPKIIDGKKVLIERIDYVLGYSDLCQITARTLHLYPEE
ncbi:hypothetical protein [Parabacteroides leei]|uniref:hypothetical protein n=1 Tax=Parabacteroides leei TaxID=2939491 RepID=UPI003242AC52